MKRSPVGDAVAVEGFTVEAVTAEPESLTPGAMVAALTWPIRSEGILTLAPQLVEAFTGERLIVEPPTERQL